MSASAPPASPTPKTELPLRLPHVSPAKLAWLRRGFALLQGLSPDLAAKAAFHLFLRSFRQPLRPEDAAALARTRRQRLTVGSDAVEVHEWGSNGPLAVIVHGWGSSAARFTRLAEALSARGWHVVVFDAPGHGASPGSSSSLPQFIAALDAVVAHYGAPQALIGHSLGALAIASRHAEGPPSWAKELRAVVLISMPSGAPFLLDIFIQMIGLSPATRRQLLRRFDLRFHASPERYTALPGGARITAPLLLVHDQGDDIVPFAHSQELHRELARTQLLATTSLGHSSLTRDPATITRIVDFVTAAPAPVTVRRADLAAATDAAMITALIDAYARDPRGGGTPLPQDVRERLVPGLAAHPTSRAWLAFDGDEAVGVCVGFVGYSTFAAQPLLNIHDLAVLPGHRGRGIGRALLAGAEQGARAEGCCKLTLEVLEDNLPARGLYEAFGFHDVRYGDSGPMKFLGKPLRETR
jgi:pimeloyl-ACP methyl ester carboxylesterase/GNAT superfamily N-acetyltransferase